MKKYDEIFRAAKMFALLSGLGFYFVGVVALCIFLGHLADEKLALGGKGKIVGILLGFPVAIYSFWRQIKTLQK